MIKRELRTMVEQNGWTKAAMVIAMDDAIRQMDDWEILMTWLTYGLPDGCDAIDLKEAQFDNDWFDELEQVYNELVDLYNETDINEDGMCEGEPLELPW